MSEEKKSEKKAVDLTDPNSANEISDDELNKVVGGLSRTTLQTSVKDVKPTTQLSAPTLSPSLGTNFETVYGGVGNDGFLGDKTFDKFTR